MAETGKVLLFNFKEGPKLQAIRTALFLLQVPSQLVGKEHYGLPLKEILKKDTEAPLAGTDGRELAGEMMVFAGLEEEKLESLLTLLRSNPACGKIPCKAVLTRMNQDWNAYMLYEELCREHAAMCKARTPAGETDL